MQCQTRAPQMMRLAHVKSRTGLSRSTIYSFMRSGTFPARVPLGARAVGWVDVEIEAWVNGRIGLRDCGGIA